VGDSAILVRDCRLGGRWISRILLDAANEIERSVKRLVVLRIWRDIGLRPRLLVALGLFIRTLNDWKANKPPGTQHIYTHAGYILLAPAR
jgi:hypothetical protein